MYLLTNSRLATFRRCQREDVYRYRLGIVPPQSEAQGFGTLIHAGLEAWFSTRSMDAVIKALRAVPSVDPFDLIRAEEMMFGYDRQWHEDEFDLIAVEAEFRIPLLNPDSGAASRTFELAGKLDALIRDALGQVWIVEHKTSSQDISPGSGYMERLVMDSQVSMYHKAAQQLGYHPIGVLYDVLKKPNLKPLKATPTASRKYTKEGVLYATQRAEDETPGEYRVRIAENIRSHGDEYYRSTRVVRLDEEVVQFERELWQQASALKDSIKDDIAPRNPDACMRYGVTCAYFDLCAGRCGVDDPRWVRTSDGNTELGQP